MQLTINITEDEGLSFFSRIGIEVKSVEVTETEPAYHNTEMELKRRTLAITCPHSGKLIDFKLAYQAVMQARLKELLFTADRFNVYLTLKDLPKLNITNNEQN